MKLHRTKNAISGTIFGVILKCYQIIIPFIIRTIFLYYLGVEYLGLNSLFTSIIQVLNVAELGIGSALVFSMYEPIAKNNKEKVSALLALYKKYYTIIGFVVLGAGLLLFPFLPQLITGNVPNDIDINILYLINLSATVLSYWLFSYKNSLFLAHQRNDLISIVGLFINTIKYIIEIIIILLLKNYYMYLFVNVFSQILNNIVIAILSKKYYPQYNASGKLSEKEIKEINGTVKDLFTCKIGQIITDSFDTIVISTFLGLTVLAVYQNYFYIISSLIAIYKILFKSLVAGVGNSLVVDSKEKNYNDFCKINYFFNFLTNFCFSSLVCLYNVFMKIWMKDDALILEPTFDILFAIYFLVYVEMLNLELYKDADGNWHKDRLRPLISALINLLINLLTVKTWGLYGIICSTIFSILLINIPWIFFRVFKDIFSEENKKYFIKVNIKYKILIFISCFLCFTVCELFNYNNLIIKLLINLCICIFISNVIYLCATRNQEEYKFYCQKARSFFKRGK